MNAEPKDSVVTAPLGRLSRLALTGADEVEMAQAAVDAVSVALDVEMAKYLELRPKEGTFVLRAAVDGLATS